MATQYAMLSYGLKLGACVLSLATASYLYAIALSNCIKVDLTSIQSQNAQMENFQSIILRRIAEFIEMHSSEQQLS